MGWLGFSIGRLRVEFSVGIALLAAVLWWLRPPLGPRYLLLLSVLCAHELAHALVSLRLGGTRAVVKIWPYFGRADVESMPDRREAWVALAGPSANLVIAGGLALAGLRPTLELATAEPGTLLLTAHLAMGTLNLIPFGPIDGGRAWRAWRRPSDKDSSHGSSRRVC